MERSSSHGQATRRIVDARCDEYEAKIAGKRPRNLENELREVEVSHRVPLLKELLPIEISDLETRNGYLPTLRELTDAHPKLAKAIRSLYPSLPEKYILPEKLGPYVIDRSLFAGNQAKMARARDPNADDRFVAIKYSSFVGEIERLRRERDLLARARHKNIVEVISAGEQRPYFYLVMPYLRGGNLQSTYKDHRPSPIIAAQIILQVAHAVQHLHELRIMHSDIKPANIHLDPSSPSDSVRLIDLGIAVDFDSWSLPQERLLHVGGTKEYMPPEQLIYDEKCDGCRCDIYSLGGVLYFLLTGNPPFNPEAAANGLRNVKAPSKLKAIARRALSAKPSDRYATAAEFVDELEGYVRTIAIRSSLLKWSVPVVPAIGVAIAGVAFGWFGGDENSVLPASEASLLSASQELGIDLDTITAKDFRVSIVPVASSVGLQGEEFGADNYVAKIVVEADEPISELMPEVEYRVGNRPWRNLHREVYRKGSIGDLTDKDITAGGPVQLRLDSEQGHGVGRVVAGPFTYDISLPAIMQEQNSKDIADIKARWKEAKPPWIRRELRGWEFMVNHLQLPQSPVKEIRIGLSPNNLTDVVSTQTTGDVPPGTFGDPNFRDYFREVQDRFSQAANKYATEPALYAQLIFVDGSASAVVAFEGQNLFGLPSQEELLRQAKPSIPTFDPAESSGGDFGLEGLKSR